MALPLAPLAAAVAKLLLDYGLTASMNLSYLWERSSLSAAINWAPLVASVLAPQLKSVCSFVSSAYNVGVPLVRVVRFAHLVAQIIAVFQPVTQLFIVLIVSYGGFVAYMSLPAFVARTVCRFLPRRVRAHPFFLFTQGLRFARCANSLRVALKFEQLYQYALAFFTYLFVVATLPYVATALEYLYVKICSMVVAIKALYVKICSIVEAIQAPLRRLADKCRAAKATTSQAPLTAGVTVTGMEVELLRRTARRPARKAAKAAVAAQAPKTLRRSLRLDKKA